MYRNLHHDIILTPPYDIAARPTGAHNIDDVKVTAPRRHPRIRRLVGICVSGVYRGDHGDGHRGRQRESAS